jgi:phosphatidylglycerol lysyltransferase
MQKSHSPEELNKRSPQTNPASAAAQQQREKERQVRIRRTLKGSKRRFLVSVWVAAVTFGSGVLNLFSIMGGPSPRTLLLEVFPLEFVRFSRTSTMLIGFALIISSINIYRRKRRAWAIVLGLSILSAFFQITRGLHYEEAAMSLALFVILLATRRMFSVRSSIPDFWGTLGRLTVAAAVAVGYGVAGFWFLDEKHFGINFHIGDAVATTLRLLSLNTDPRLIPRTQYAHWFLDSLYVITFVAVLYGAFALFRPVIHQFRTVPRERQLAGSIVGRFGRTTMDYFKLWRDKSYFFSPTNQCFIAYAVAGNVAVALGDPVGPEEEIEPTIREFLEFCRDNGWAVGFHQTLPDFLQIYRKVGLKKLKIGDDAIVELSKFTLEGKSKRELRCKAKQLEGMGIEIRHYDAPVNDRILKQLKEVSDEWLQIPGRRERTFTLGHFDEAYLRSTSVFAAVDKDDRILAFLNLISSHGRGEITGDLMRRRTDAPNGIMDYLFVKLFLYCKQQGYERFNLGMAPMAGFQEREEATAEERAIHGFFQQLNFIFSFRGLRYYKAKFATHWEPRYLIYRNALELPRIAFALRRVSELKNGTTAEEHEAA